MAAIGGSIETVSLDGRSFPVAADADSQRKLGGFENATEPNGDGSARLIKSRVSAGLDGLTLSIDDSRGDQDFLQVLADRSDFFPVAVIYGNGEIWQGTLQITGEMQVSNQSTTAAVSLGGPGKLTRQ